MRKILLSCLLLAGMQVVVAQSSKEGEVCYNPNLVKDTTKKSIKSKTVALIGTDSISIIYHSPGVRKRVIWGGLVPYDEVWVTGAHDATLLEVPKAIEIGGKTLAPGKYAIFSIPGKKEWILIINKNWQQHLASEYDEAVDLVRIKVKPKKQGLTERLQYTLQYQEQSGKGTISWAWEKLGWEIPFTLK